MSMLTVNVGLAALGMDRTAFAATPATLGSAVSGLLSDCPRISA